MVCSATRFSSQGIVLWIHSRSWGEERTWAHDALQWQARQEAGHAVLRNATLTLGLYKVSAIKMRTFNRVLTSLASFSYSSISFSFSWLTASTLQILLAAVSAWRTVWLITKGKQLHSKRRNSPVNVFLSRRSRLPAPHQQTHGRSRTRRSWWLSRQVLECSRCLAWGKTSPLNDSFDSCFYSLKQGLYKGLRPSASSILGMSRYFSATSKAVLRLPMGSSCESRRHVDIETHTW